MAVQFIDEQSNPMAAGVEVSLFAAPFYGEIGTVTPIATDWTQAGGICPFLLLTDGSDYVATFSGRQGPTVSVAFAGDGKQTTVVQVLGYRSPALTNTNWTIFQAQTLYPNGVAWWGDAARQSGGVAWAVAAAFGEILEFADEAGQARLAAARVQSSSGPTTDSWVNDFCGQWLPRLSGETDPAFKARSYYALSSPKNTIAAIQGIVEAYFASVASTQIPSLAFDGVGAFDSPQGIFDALEVQGIDFPTITVWDRQSEPGLADTYNVNPQNDNGDFVIQLAFSTNAPPAWYLDENYLDFDAWLVNISQVTETPFDPRLGALVQWFKAAGTHPLYLETYVLS